MKKKMNKFLSSLKVRLILHLAQSNKTYALCMIRWTDHTYKENTIYTPM
jgi:hypothetical protein